MGYNSIYVQGLQEALVEKEKATAAIDGLIKRIAEIKASQLEKFLDKEQPLLSEGFVFAKVSHETYTWASYFILKAYFLLKDIAVPNGATAKEIKLINEYKGLVRDLNWKNSYRVSDCLENAKKINSKISGLKNEIEVVKVLEWKFYYGDILEGESFFERGFSIRK